MADLPPGTKLDRFLIRKQLGRGALGAVYLADDTVRSGQVAVKLVQVHPAGPSDILRQLQREKACYDTIQDHRHVIKVHDLHQVQSGGTTLLLLSMEYADGGTFRKWLLDHRDDWAARRTQGLVYFKQLCRGVAAIHDAGLLHLDPKPDNAVFVGGVLKLADLGIAQPLPTAVPGRPGPSAPSSAVPGTPGYASPPSPGDQGHAPDARDDIYGLGAILYEILHPQGRRPLDDSPPGPSDVQQPDPHPTPPGAGRVEARVIQRCLQKDPAGRYQQVTQLLDDLEQPLASEHQGASDEQATELLQAACRCAADRQFKKAARLCEEILQRWPNHGPAAHLLDELHAREEQGRELYAAVESGLDSRDLEELLRLLERAIEVWPDHPSRPQLQIRLAERARQYAEAMELGVESTGRADFQSARSWFQRALQQNPGSGEAKRCLDLVERILHDKQDARGRIDAAIAAGNGDLALAIARRIDAEIRGLVESARRPDTGGRP